MIEDSINEFYMASSGEETSGIPAPRRHSTGPPPAPIATTLWLEDTPAIQTMTTVQPRMLTPQPDIVLPSEQRHAFREVQ
jgi:hypothetical protein